MKKIQTLWHSAAISLITTGIILTFSFLIMLFKSGDDGLRYSYFKSLFFESETINGIVTMTFGFHDYLPILITFVTILAVIYVLYSFIYRLRNN